MRTNIKYLMLINMAVLVVIGMYLFGVSVPVIPAIKSTVSYIFWLIVNNWGIITLVITNVIGFGWFLLYISAVYEETTNKTIGSKGVDRKLVGYLEKSDIKNDELKQALTTIFNNREDIFYINVYYSLEKLTDRYVTEVGVREIVKNIELYPNNEEFINLLSALTSYNENEVRAYAIYHKIKGVFPNTGKMQRIEDLQKRTIDMASDIHSKRKEMALSALMSIEEGI